MTFPALYNEMTVSKSPLFSAAANRSIAVLQALHTRRNGDFVSLNDSGNMFCGHVSFEQSGQTSCPQFRQLSAFKYLLNGSSHMTHRQFFPCTTYTGGAWALTIAKHCARLAYDPLTGSMFATSRPRAHTLPSQRKPAVSVTFMFIGVRGTRPGMADTDTSTRGDVRVLRDSLLRLIKPPMGCAATLPLSSMATAPVPPGLTADDGPVDSES